MRRYGLGENMRSMVVLAESTTTYGDIYAAVFLYGMVVALSTWILIFVRAGQPWWAALVPILNGVVLLQIVSRPIWWIALMFIPFVGQVVFAIVFFDVARCFGRSRWFAWALILLFPIFVVVFDLLLLFNKARYEGSLAGRAPVLAM